jgi:hypothetical protein
MTNEHESAAQDQLVSRLTHYESQPDGTEIGYFNLTAKRAPEEELRTFIESQRYELAHQLNDMFPSIHYKPVTAGLVNGQLEVKFNNDAALAFAAFATEHHIPTERPAQEEEYVEPKNWQGRCLESLGQYLCATSGTVHPSWEKREDGRPASDAAVHR